MQQRHTVTKSTHYRDQRRWANRPPNPEWTCCRV